MTDLLYATDVVRGRAGYAPTNRLAQAFDDGRVSRAWMLGPRLVSIQLDKDNGKGIWKSTDRLPMDPEAANENLDRLEACGVRHPASFADCYHQLAQNWRPLPWTYNGLFMGWQGGPWSEALQIGELTGKWYRYDLRSAYRWASHINGGLPDPETYRVTTELVDSEPGLWVIQLEPDAIETLPAAFRTTEPVVMSTEEIWGYGVRDRASVIRGLTWTRTLGSRYVEQTLAMLPCPKEAGRAYWGRWIARDPLECWTPARKWQMKNVAANFVWGWLIVGRVRLRVWEQAHKAAHVYVDEIVIPHEIETGNNPGDWQLKGVYSHGVNVRRTGHYGPRDGPLTMQTGVSDNAAQRQARLN